MIEWIEYDKNNRAIESHVNHLVTNGQVVLIAQHQSTIGTNHYHWKCNMSIIPWVTHWAKINLPQANKATEQPSNVVAEAVTGLKETTP